MADVRSLLRQQRAARRITHPHASYSDAGKLVCTLCREHVSSELFWEVHVLSPLHRERLEKLEAASTEADSNQVSNKRKHEDEDMEDAAQDEDEEGSRKKRSRLEASDRHGQVARDGEVIGTPQKHTPPLPRRSSGTPSHGVEMQIPSRPATPVAVRTEVSRTRSNSNLGEIRSPLGIQNTTPAITGVTSNGVGGPTITASGPAGDKAQDEEDLFAAFEADLLKNDSAPRVPTIDAPAEAVIAAPAMTADELAAQSVEEERTKRRLAADVELDDEKEDAARALEEEFEDMEELEARVRRLKERREALRHQTQAKPPSEVPSASATIKVGAEDVSNGKENAGDRDADTDNDEDDDDDDDVDDWDSFRFRR
ncbi:hypothetical protein DL546_003080 [Coniochaeta pulveracea]|uniref:Uncharacterized protein n=1 Tax=Coniochaeta pulveracea TaxID=177199 RepID=A0A420YMP5_9PEZI|nr:hypothetical protein DL546_003080 [Coniochaeta pulveracea]